MLARSLAINDLGGDGYYMAFSLNTPTHWWNCMRKALAAIKRNGTYDTLRKSGCNGLQHGQTGFSPNRSLAVRLVLASLVFCLLYTGGGRWGAHVRDLEGIWSTMDSNLKLIEDACQHT